MATKKPAKFGDCCGLFCFQQIRKRYSDVKEYIKLIEFLEKIPGIAKVVDMMKPSRYWSLWFSGSMVTLAILVYAVAALVPPLLDLCSAFGWVE